MIQQEPTESPSIKAIKDLRILYKLSSKQASELAGISEATWNKMETGSIKMPGKVWDKINAKVKTLPKKLIKQRIIDASNYELKDIIKNSKAWFTSEAKRLAGSREGKITSSTVSHPVPGEMYMYYYDAKHKDTLPYWDKFPLVFPFRMLPDGFIGINLHYLHYKQRILLLDALQEIASSPRKSTSMKLSISYDILRQVAKNKKFEKCIHRYLYDHFRTPIKKIHSDNWLKASLIPNEMFVGETKEYIWKQ
jgi:hypothetical protein